MSESEFVDVDGGRLFHVRDGEGPAVVLIHGAPTLDHRMWADQVAPLARSHTVVRYDLRGYGRSSLPIDPYRHCDDLASLISGLDLDRAVLGGMSFGAAVALDTALAHPTVATGLILAPLAPLPGWTWIEGFPLAPALRQAGSATTRTVVDAILALPMNDAARERPDVLAALDEMGRSYSGWHFTNRDPGTWAAPEAVDRLGEIDVPLTRDHRRSRRPRCPHDRGSSRRQRPQRHPGGPEQCRAQPEHGGSGVVQPSVSRLPRASR